MAGQQRQRRDLAGGTNRTHVGDGTSANTPDGFSRPFPPSIRHNNSVPEFWLAIAR
jgi:hypothetical protein